MGGKVRRCAWLTISLAASPKAPARWILIAIWVRRLMDENCETRKLMGTAQSVRSTG